MNFLELIRHTMLHRKRVIIIAGHLLRNHPTIRKRLVSLHDLEKFLFLPLLWLYSGGRGNRVHARKVYDAMNRVGDAIFNAYSWWSKASPYDVQQAKYYERIADVVDRHCHPDTPREMGRESTSLADWLEPSEGYHQALCAEQEYWLWIPPHLI